MYQTGEKKSDRRAPSFTTLPRAFRRNISRELWTIITVIREAATVAVTNAPRIVTTTNPVIRWRRIKSFKIIWIKRCRPVSKGNRPTLTDRRISITGPSRNATLAVLRNLSRQLITRITDRETLLPFPGARNRSPMGTARGSPSPYVTRLSWTVTPKVTV